MTWRSNTSATTSGGWIASRYTGLGVPSAEIPAAGDSGPAYLYNDSVANGVGEYRGVILTQPSAGTFITYETSAFSFTDAPDGVYTATYRGYKNGVSYGDYEITMNIGGEDKASTIAYDIGGIDWAVSATATVAGNSAAIAYDIGQIEFSSSVSVAAPVNSANASYDIGQITFAADLSVTAAPTDNTASISYDIGAISFNVAIISGEINNLYGVGSGIVFIEPKSGFSYTK